MPSAGILTPVIMIDGGVGGVGDGSSFLPKDQIGASIVRMNLMIKDWSDLLTVDVKMRGGEWFVSIAGLGDDIIGN